MESPHYRGYEVPNSNFDRARSQIATPFLFVDIALDSAGSNQIFNISGDFLYADTISDGIVTVELNNQYNDAAAPFKVQAGWAINAVFKQLKISWTAQAGKKIRLMYSTGERVIPALTGSLSISGTTNVALTTPEQPQVYGASFSSNTTMLANAPTAVFTAVQNPNGAIIHSAGMMDTWSGGPPSSVLIAKATAPASVVDGDILLLSQSESTVGAVYSCSAVLHRPIKVPAGKGLYFISGNVQSTTIESVLYTLL